MKKGTYSLALVVAIGGAFLAGAWHTTGSTPAALQSARAPHLHGLAVDPARRSASSAGGALTISPETQQIIGVAVSAVERTAIAQKLRLLGRVAADETRLYRLNAGIDGAIREVSSVTTGSEVRKDQLLATFNAPNALSALQIYIVNMGGSDRLKRLAAEGSVELQGVPLAHANIKQRIDQLRNYGISPLQLEEIARTREIPESIKIVAPADGVVLARAVSPGLKFERGFEFYRIADLRRVWIVADVFEHDARELRPGTRARVSLPAQRHTFTATVSAVLPQFDATTRTHKVRLEADNPGYLLRPDMFVDVEVAVRVPPTIAVPLDAVIDAGLTRTVFVEREPGVFEPRRIETGRRFGDRVEVVTGLTAGERVVTSGTFLLDSESRLRLPVTAAAASPAAPPAPTGHAHRADDGGGHGQARTPPAHDHAGHQHAKPAR